MNKFCQSCGMPLEKHQGTETDGTLSNEYCEMYYHDGQFIEPNITFDQMLKRGIDGLNNSQRNFFSKKFMIWGYPYQLKKLVRWR